MAGLTLHVGAHKTATTYLQQILSAQQQALLQHNVNYVMLSKNLRTLLGAVSRKSNQQILAEAAQMMEKELSASPSGHNVLVSWEGLLGAPIVVGGLYPQSAIFAEFFKEFFRNSDSRVVLYVRRQDDFLASAYVQSVKEGSALSFDAYLDQVDYAQLEWRTVIEPWQESGAKITVAPYETIRMGHSAFVAPIAAAIGLTAEELPGNPAVVVNRSYTNKALSAALAVNGVVDLSRQESKQLRRYLERLFADGDKPELLTVKHREDIAHACRTANLALAAEFGFPERISAYYGFEPASEDFGHGSNLEQTKVIEPEPMDSDPKPS
jgi:DNA-binding phage protein